MGQKDFEEIVKNVIDGLSVWDDLEELAARCRIFEEGATRSLPAPRGRRCRYAVRAAETQD